MSEIVIIKKPLDEFESKLKERIRKDIGDLLPDSVLSEMIKKSLDELFFKPNIIRKEDSYRSSLVREQTFAESVIEPLLQEQVSIEVNKWFDGNKDKICSMVEDILKKGMGGIFIECVSNYFSSSLFNLKSDILQNMGGYKSP